VVWNFPIDVSFSATNAHGWPRMVLSVYGLDILGRDVVQGYGQLHIPTTPGVYTRYVRMFKPVSLSWAQQLTSWIFGNQAEFYDSKFVGQGKNRDVTRVQTTGVVKVKINVLTHNMAKFGFSDGLADEPVAAAKAKGARGRSRGRSPRPGGGRGRSSSPRPRSSKSPVRSKR
jgi:B9 domain-containing protein 1